MSLSRGAKECLKLMRRYAAKYDDVYPFQATIAKHLGVKDRQLRNYFSELKIAGLLEIRKGGPKSAIYHVVAEKNCRSIAGQIAGLLPVKTAASINYSFTDLENLDQSTAEPTDRYAEVKIESLRRHLRVAGFEHLTERIVAEANARAIGLFVIAARIERALRNASRKESTKPRGDGWVWRVSGLAGTASERQVHAAQGDPARGFLPNGVVHRSGACPHETHRLSLAEEDRASVSGEVAAILDSPFEGGEPWRASETSGGAHAPVNSAMPITALRRPIAFGRGKDSEPGCDRTSADSAADTTSDTSEFRMPPLPELRFNRPMSGGEILRTMGVGV